MTDKHDELDICRLLGPTFDSEDIQVKSGVKERVASVKDGGSGRKRARNWKLEFSCELCDFEAKNDCPKKLANNVRRHMRTHAAEINRRRESNKLDGTSRRYSGVGRKLLKPHLFVKVRKKDWKDCDFVCPFCFKAVRQMSVKVHRSIKSKLHHMKHCPKCPRGMTIMQYYGAFRKLVGTKHNRRHAEAVSSGWRKRIVQAGQHSGQDADTLLFPASILELLVARILVVTCIGAQFAMRVCR